MLFRFYTNERCPNLSRMAARETEFQNTVAESSRRRKVEMTEKKKMITLCDLTEDLLMDIMSRLRVKCVMRCRCVSKPWRSLLTNNPTFNSLHSNRSKLNPPNVLLHTADYPSGCAIKQFKTLTPPEFECKNLNAPLIDAIEVLGSCNGIFCIYANKLIYFWNPSTGEHTEIAYDRRICNRGKIFGFGYDSVREEYKLVVIDLKTRNSTKEDKVMVFSTGTNLWRRVEVVSEYPCITKTKGVLVNEVLHWLSEYYGDFQFRDLIISFDLKTEKFGEITLPDSNHNSEQFERYILLGKLNEDLVVSYYFQTKDLSTDAWWMGRVDLWMMEGYGANKSWIKAYSIQQGTIVDRCLETLVIWKNGKVLLSRGSYDLVLYDPVAETGMSRGGYDLVLYDPVPKMGRDPFVCGVFKTFNAYAYVEALTSVPPLVAGNGLEG